MDTSRIITLAKSQGKSITYICGLVGRYRGYIKDVGKTASAMPKEFLQVIAADLGTTPEYLLFETDDPALPANEHSAKSGADSAVAQPTLTEQEKMLVDMFRGTTEQGRMRIIQAVMNVCDEIEKKPARTGQTFVG